MRARIFRVALSLSTAFIICALFGVARGAPGRPTLLSEQTSTRAVALESVTLRSGPFPLTAPVKIGDDDRTRVMIFAMNIYMFAGEDLNDFYVDAEDAQGKHHQLKVEFVGRLPAFEGITEIIVVLNEDLGDAGDVLVRLTLHGIQTNRVRLSVGHTGGGPPDDVGAAPTPAPQTPPAVIPTLDAYTGAATGADTARFMEQAAFGPTRMDVPRVQAMGFRAYLNEQFSAPASSYTSMPLYPLDDQVGCPSDPNNPSKRPDCMQQNYSTYPLQIRFYKNAMSGQDQLRQRVSFALHQIFVVSGRDLIQPSWMAPYLQTLDRNAFGNFRQLLQEITLNPAMGRYLDMAGNSRVNPNENYAREVLQLFTVGPDLLNIDGTPRLDAAGNRIPTYNQATVTNFARVFTGWTFAPPKLWTVDNKSPVVNFADPMVVTNNANVHDTDAKTLLNGAVIPAGLTAEQDLNAALDNIFNHPNVAPFVSMRLIRSLVTSNPSPAYVERVAVVFNNNCAGLYPDAQCTGERGDLKGVVRAILLDPEARGDVKTEADYGRLREPAVFMVSLCRSINDTLNISLFDFVVHGERMDEDVFRPPSVFGYFPADYVVPGTRLAGPEFGTLSASSLFKRLDATYALTYRDGLIYGVADPTSQFSLMPLVDDPVQLVDLLNRLMLHGTMPAEMRQTIIQAVSSVPPTPNIFPSYKLRRMNMAVYLIATSTQYQIQR